MLKLLGYTFLLIGFAGLIFFISYHGTVIPLQALWFVLSFILMMAGVYSIIKYKWQKAQQQSVKSDRFRQIQQLKLTGEKIKVTLDNSEVKTRSYQREIISTRLPSQIEMLDGLYGGNRNYKTEEMLQTYIVFYKRYGNKTYKFISSPASQANVITKRHIDEKGGIDLYVDKTNPSNYYFDFP